MLSLLYTFKKNESKKSKISLKFSWHILVCCFVEATIFLCFQPCERSPESLSSFLAIENSSSSCQVQWIGFCRNISHIKKKNRKNQASLFYFKKLNKVHHETAHDRRHVRDPYSFTDRNDSSSFNYENFIKEYHVYIKVWSPLLGECLFGKKEHCISLGHIVTLNLKSLENVWTVLLVIDLKLRQGFVFMGLKRLRSSCKLD